MAVVRNLMVRAGADFSALTSATQKGAASVRKMQSSVSKSTGMMTASLRTLKTAMGAIGIAGGIYAIIDFGKSAVKAASDLQEIQNVVDVTFGANNQAIENFANTALKNFGLSELAAKKYSSSIGAMGKSMGFASGQNEQMATTITGLIGDMASFRNVSTDEAYTAMAAIYTGETESLKRYGILITETNLQEYARTQGISKSIAAMTQQEKTLLRYNYILSATSDYQGDFVRTQDSWANQTRVLAGQFEQLKAALGTGLIQALTPVVKMLNTIMAGLINLANTFSAVTASLFGKQAAVASVTADTATTAADAENELAGATTAAGKAAKGALAGFDKLNVLQQNTGSGGIGTVKTTTTKTDTSGSSGDGSKGFAINPKINLALLKLKDAFGRLKESVTDFWNNSGIQEWLKILGNSLLTRLIDSLCGALMWLSGTIDVVSGVIKIITSLIKGDWSGAIEGVKQVFFGLGEMIEGVFTIILGKKAVDSIKTFISTWVTNITAWWTNSVAPWFTAEKWTALWSNVKTSWANNWATIMTWWNESALVTWWNDSVAPWFTAEKWVGMMAGVQTAFTTTFKNAINGAIGLFNTFIGWLNGKMKFTWPGLSIAGKQLFPGGSMQLFTIPPITPLATGGIADSATLSMIGESGREAVLPLENNTGWMDTLAAKIGSQSIRFSGPSSIQKLVQMLQPEIVRENNRRGSKLIFEGGVL